MKTKYDILINQLAKQIVISELNSARVLNELGNILKSNNPICQSINFIDLIKHLSGINGKFVEYWPMKVYISEYKTILNSSSMKVEKANEDEIIINKIRFNKDFVFLRIKKIQEERIFLFKKIFKLMEIKELGNDYKINKKQQDKYRSRFY